MTTTRLTRDLDEAMLGGVLSGIATHYRWDPTLLRIVAALVTIATGVVPGVLIYLGGWLIIPRPESAVPSRAADEPTTEDEAPAPTASQPTTSQPPAVTDEIAQTLRDTADRLSEAATIAAEAARRAANEIGDVARRPRGVAVEDQPARGVAVEDPPAAAAPADETSEVPDAPALDDTPEADESTDDTTERSPSA